MARAAAPVTAEVRARLAGLLALADGSVPYRELAARAAAGGAIAVADATAGGRAFAWSALAAVSGRTVLLVAPNEDRARRWRAELAGWLGDDRVVLFPERESMPYETASPSASAVHQRLLALWRLREATPLAVVAPLRALLQHTIAPADLAERGRALHPGDALPWQATATWLISLGYEPVPEVSEPGTFSRRGGIIDVYPASATQPARVELFGDLIDTIRSFDPVTQRSQAPVEELVILPAREIAVHRGPDLAERLAGAGWDVLPEGLAPFAALQEGARQGAYVAGLDAFAPLLGAASSLLAHLPPDRSTVVFEDSVELALAWDSHEAQADERREELRAEGLPVAAFPPPYVPRTQLEREAAARGSIRVAPQDDALRLGWGSAPGYAGRLDRLPHRDRHHRERNAAHRVAAGRAPGGAARGAGGDRDPPRDPSRAARARVARAPARAPRGGLRDPGARPAGLHRRRGVRLPQAPASGAPAPPCGGGLVPPGPPPRRPRRPRGFRHRALRGLRDEAGHRGGARIPHPHLR